MLARVAFRAATAARSVQPRVWNTVATMSTEAPKIDPEEGHIHGEREGLTGIARKEEIAKLAAGEDFDLFDRDATAFFEEGTKENPIVILSNEPTRIVGMSLEDDAFVRFFILREGAVYRDPLYDNHFVLKVQDDADVDKQIDEIDAKMGPIQPGV